MLKIIYGNNASGKTRYYENLKTERFIKYNSNDVDKLAEDLNFDKLNIPVRFETKEMQDFKERYEAFLKNLANLVEVTNKYRKNRIWSMIEKYKKEDSEFDFGKFLFFSIEESIGGKVFSIDRVLFYDDLLNYDYDIYLNKEQKKSIIKFIVSMKIGEEIKKWNDAFSDTLNLEVSTPSNEGNELNSELINSKFFKMCSEIKLSKFLAKKIPDIINSDYSGTNHSWDLKNALLYELISLEDDKDLVNYHGEAKKLIEEFSELQIQKIKIYGETKSDNQSGVIFEKKSGEFEIYFKDILINSSLVNDFTLNYIDNEMILTGKSEDLLLSTGQKTLIFIFEKISSALALNKDIVFDDILETIDDFNKKYIIDELTKVSKDISIEILTHEQQVLELIEEDEKVDTYYLPSDSNLKTKGSNPKPVRGSKLLHKNASNFIYDKQQLGSQSYLPQKILRITYRVFGRGVANYQKFFTSNKKYSVNATHGETLYIIASEMVLHYKNFRGIEFWRYFAEDKNWIKAMNAKDSLEFCQKIILEIDSIIKGKDNCYYGVSFYALKDLWKNLETRLVIEKNNISSTGTRNMPTSVPVNVQNEIHYLDLTNLK